jgi:hypothetical protein
MRALPYRPLGDPAAAGTQRHVPRSRTVRVATRGAGAGPASTIGLLIALVVLSVIVTGTLSGCGGTSSTAAELRLQREDLVAVARALATVERPVAIEVAAAKRAWPSIANGLPTGAGAPASARAPVATASRSAARVSTPPVLGEAQADSLTGPGAGLAGLFRNYIGLTTRGWTLTSAAIDQIERGSPAGARFARENVGLYIESVYDGHFDLAQIGKHLSDGYRRLGGPSAFGRALTQGEVDALADAYSEANTRLHPHVGVRLGS